MNIYKEALRKYYIDEYNNRVYLDLISGGRIYFTDKFGDISYLTKESNSRCLSNLFPYEFRFRTHKMESIEGLLQSLKIRKKRLQKKLWRYSGKDAYHTRAFSFADDWRKEGILYWRGKPINRFGLEYQMFLNKMYLNLYKKQELFKKALDQTKNRVLLHSTGKTNPKETILTPDEYINRLTIIRDNLEKIAKEKLNDFSEQKVKNYNHKGYNK